MITHQEEKAAEVVRAARTKAYEKPPVGEDKEGQEVYDLRSVCAIEDAFVAYFRILHTIYFDEPRFREACGRED
jgi:hypothetical protein